MRELLRVKEIRLFVAFVLTIATIAAAIGVAEGTAWCIRAIFPALNYWPSMFIGLGAWLVGTLVVAVIKALNEPDYYDDSCE